MDKYNFDVIVIGGNHFNALGVIRALGENDIKPYLIITGNKNSYVAQSKYVLKSFIVEKNEKAIIELLLKRFKSTKKRTYIIPTGDFPASVIDKNYNILKEKYVIPNINNTENAINQYMDKHNQYKLAKANNFKMAKTLLLNIEDKKIENDIYPCILKPSISATGEKKDIRICNNKEEFNKAISEFKEKKYSEVLLQEFIDYDFEIDVPGYANGKEVIIPGMINKVNIYPAKRGSTCYGLVTNPNIVGLNKLKNIIKQVNYNGIFDIELFSKNNLIYLNEINFRNSAISYSLTREKIYIALEWILLNEKIEYSKNKIKKEYYFIVEDYNFKLVLDKEIKLKKFIKELLYAKKYAYLNLKDPKPIFYKMINSLKKEKQ